jgi:hypothetical protein
VYRYLLGWIILLEDGRIAYSRHVMIDEREFLEGGHTPFHTTFGPARVAELEAAAAAERRAAAAEAAEHANEPRAGPAGLTGINGSYDGDTYLTREEEWEDGRGREPVQDGRGREPAQDRRGRKPARSEGHGPR